ncbi:MAG: hypothetical protein LBT23_07325 [Synergistaceae bacterium]|jgi:hypothetical protein|nr:hypothetical protein [Synergistaceae bacterium]
MNIESTGENIDALRADFKTPTADEYVEAREKSKRKMFLTPHTAEDLKARGAKLYLTADGVGFALKPDGDIIGVFNNSQRPGAGVDAMVLAIAEGGKKLDAIDSWLTNYYKRFGFVEKERMKWDDELAPDGWEYSTGGRPDVVFFEYPDNLGREPSDIARRFELARSGETAGGSIFSNGNSENGSGNDRRTWGRSKLVLGEQEASPGSTGTDADILKDNQRAALENEGGSF